MSRPFTGGCACGAIRYEVDAEPISTNDCQCRDCQRESGTGHASHLMFPRDAAKVQGEAIHWEAVGEQGLTKRRAFCPICGSPVYTTFPAMPAFIVIRAASLDDPSLYTPQQVLWTSAQPWDRIDPKLPSFAKMPPSSKGHANKETDGSLQDSRVAHQIEVRFNYSGTDLPRRKSKAELGRIRPFSPSLLLPRKVATSYPCANAQ